MNNEIIENGDVVYYVLRVNGQNMTGKLESKMLAEMEKQKLSPELRELAEIVPVTSDGSQLLLG